MSAFIYLWNPTRDPWEDFRDAMFRINNGEAYLDRWSCGNRKQISPGDIFFLMRTGVPDRGIIGFGQILASPETVPHWDSKEAAKGATSLMTEIVFLGLQPIRKPGHFPHPIENIEFNPPLEVIMNHSAASGE